MNYFKLSKFFLFLVPFAIVIISTSTLFPFIVGKYVFFRTTIDLALIFFLLGLLLQDKLSVVINHLLSVLKNPLVIAVSIFTFIFLLAGFFGVDPANSFWSNFERGEGGFQMIHLWLFFLLLVALFREEKDWRKLFWVSIIAGIFMAFYGFGAGLKYVDAEWTTVIKNGNSVQELSGRGGFLYQAFKNFIGPQFNERFHGTLGNPAYVATYSIFLLFYVAYLYLGKFYKKTFSWQSLPLYISSIIFLIVFWMAATRGAFMGLILAIIMAVGYFAYIYKPWRKWLFSGIAILIISVSAMVYLKNTAFVKSIPGSRIFDISFSAKTWEDRTYMWKMAWDGFKERPLLGWGPENYLNIFDQHFNIKYFKPAEGFGAWFDRAHSVYFDYLAETGILGLLSYLIIFIIFYWQFIKFQISNFKSQKEKLIVIDYQSLIINALLFAIPVAYLVQGLVLFEVLPLYLNLFLFLSFAIYKFNNFKF